MKFSTIVYVLLFSFITILFIVSSIGCAQIGSPSGGPKDTLAPKIVNAYPAANSVNFKANKITLNFNEYIDVKEISKNLLVSPNPKKNPVVTFKNKTVTIRLKDSLIANTTYSINLGNAIVDVHEGNIYKNLTYVFSTGKTIDSLMLTGNVIVAETGQVDTTILVLLYSANSADSAVQKFKPEYIARLSSSGKFVFKNLPSRKFKIYALGDGNGSKTYDALTEPFAFIDSMLQPSNAINPITLFAYAEKKTKPKTAAKTAATNKPSKTKKFKFTTNLIANTQDVFATLEIDFNNTLKDFEQNKIYLTDTLFNPLPAGITLDSTRQKIIVERKWKPDEYYKLIVIKEGFSDSSNTFLNKTDTINFATKKEIDYGTLALHFTDIDFSLHPVIQFLQNNIIVKSAPIIANEWKSNLFTPGDYELRILYDTNNNGIWDPGNYIKKLQPEKAISFDKKLHIKADWDNERDIKL